MNTQSKIESPLWLCIRLPTLPWEAVKLIHEDNIIISHRGLVYYCNKEHEQAGITLGSPVATAQLLVSAPIEPLNLSAQKKLYDSLKHQLYQYTPYIEDYTTTKASGIDEYSLLLEISQSLKLFKGLDNLLQYISSTIKANVDSFFGGIAHTAYASWFLSFKSARNTLQAPPTRHNNFFIEALKDLPIETIDQYPEQVEALLHMGFTTFSDLVKQIQHTKSTALKKRVGLEFIQFIEETFGIESQLTQQPIFKKPKKSFHPDYHFHDEIQFDFPVANIEHLKHPIQQLLQKLCNYLGKTQLQTQAISWLLYDIYHNREVIPVSFNQLHRDWQFVFDLSMIKFEVSNLPFEVDTLALKCEKTTPIEIEKNYLGLDKQVHTNNKDLTLTVAKLSAILGEHNLYKINIHHSHIPEKAFTTTHIHQTFEHEVIDYVKGERPTWLLYSPIPIEDQGKSLFWQGKITLQQGPERIEGDWWETPVARDYFIAIREDFIRLWIFKDLYNGNWYAHGVFG